VTNEKIKELVAERNREVERSVAATAQNLIASIVQQQDVIKGAQKAIANCREKLKALEVATVTEADILGEV
jgi:hypothetical protein